MTKSTKKTSIMAAIAAGVGTAIKHPAPRVVKTPNARVSKNEGSWRMFEKTLLARERARLIREGVIVPADRMKPQMMARDHNGVWYPQVVIGTAA